MGTAQRSAPSTELRDEMQRECLQALRAATVDFHAKAESNLDLLNPRISASRLRAVVEHFYGFWAGTEPCIDTWASSEPLLARSWSWSARRRLPGLRRDLVLLASASEASATQSIATPVFETVADVNVLSWLYVSEGSALGGKIITRHLQDLQIAQPFTAFLPYGNRAALMWRSYREAVGDWVAAQIDPATASAALVEGAVQVFGQFCEWVSPLGHELS